MLFHSDVWITIESSKVMPYLSQHFQYCTFCCCTAHTTDSSPETTANIECQRFDNEATKKSIHGNPDLARSFWFIWLVAFCHPLVCLSFRQYVPPKYQTLQQRVGVTEEIDGQCCSGHSLLSCLSAIIVNNLDLHFLGNLIATRWAIRPPFCFPHSLKRLATCRNRSFFALPFVSTSALRISPVASIPSFPHNGKLGSNDDSITNRAPGPHFSAIKNGTSNFDAIPFRITPARKTTTTAHQL